MQRHCRAAAEVQEREASSSGGNGNAPRQAAERGMRRSASEARMAVAAKISAARALARKLSEEKQAAVAAARAAAENSLDEEEIDRCTSIDVISYILGKVQSFHHI